MGARCSRIVWRFRPQRGGFSVIELMIVLAIIGILSAIAIPAYMGVQKRAKRTEFKTNLEILRLVEEKYYAEKGVYTACADTDACKVKFPEFRPGDTAKLLYGYSVTLTDSGQGFTATARGKATSPDNGISFTVNQDNTRGGW